MSRRGRRNNRRGGAGKLIFLLLFLVIIAGGAFFAYTSPLFERVAPKINVPNSLSANVNSPLKFKILDDVALKSCKVSLSAKGNEITIYNQKFLIKSKSKDIEIALPKEVLNSKIDKWDITIEAVDSSLWGFFMGNKVVYKGKMLIDNHAPEIVTIANSQSILKGGSALVVYKVVDNNLKETYVELSSGVIFKAIKYKKDGVFATLIAWPFNLDSINPKIVAIDSANNITKHTIDIRA